MRVRNFTGSTVFGTVVCWFKSSAPVLAVFILYAACGATCLGQVPTGAMKPPAFGVVRMQASKKFPRKRFFLIKGTLEENKAILDAIDRTRFLSRECYYRSVNASCSLIKWLKDNSCESPYCREININEVTGKAAVPEFQTAYNKSREEFKKAAHGQDKSALGWVTNNLPDPLRIGFYNERQKELAALLKLAQERSRNPVLSVMTDRKGTAYFTDLDPGVYVISNLIPIELENSAVVLTCEVTVKAVDLGMEKPFKMDQTNKKCSIVEKPLAVCEKELPCK